MVLRASRSDRDVSGPIQDPDQAILVQGSGQMLRIPSNSVRKRSPGALWLRYPAAVMRIRLAASRYLLFVLFASNWAADAQTDDPLSKTFSRELRPAVESLIVEFRVSVGTRRLTSRSRRSASGNSRRRSSPNSFGRCTSKIGSCDRPRGNTARFASSSETAWFNDSTTGASKWKLTLSSYCRRETRFRSCLSAAG